MQEFHDFDFLSHEKLADGLWRVVEDFGGPQKICIYVVEGQNKTAVIDAGMGATTGLRKYIETYITDKKPMINLLTHTHPDHCGGSALFDARFIHPDETSQLAWGLYDKRRLNDAAAFAFTGVPGSKAHGDLKRALAVGEYCKSNYLSVDGKTLEWQFLQDGDVVDLGGVQLDCLYLNCHGSLLFYNRAQDYCLCGDNLTYTLAVGDIDEELIAKYAGLAAKLTETTMLYSGHIYYIDNVTRPPEIDGGLLRELIRELKNIQAGVGLENDIRDEMVIVPDAPTLMGFRPEKNAPQAVWDAFNAQDSKRKGKQQKQGDKYIHMVGPIVVTYVK